MKFAAIALALFLSGCMTLTPEERLDAARARTDAAFVAARVPVREEDEVLAGALSLLGPGLGHLYLREPGWAAAWAALGLAAPFAAAPAAVADARVVNERHLASAYRAWRASATPASSGTHVCGEGVYVSGCSCARCARELGRLRR